MKITMTSNALVNVAGIYGWAKEIHRTQPRKAVNILNDCLFRGCDAPFARDILKEKVPVAVTEDTISFEYNGKAFHKYSWNISIESDGEPIEESQAYEVRTRLEEALSGTGLKYEIKYKIGA